jgi:uncharacterized protein (TIGR03000 family)
MPSSNQDMNTARIRVRLPENARVWFEDRETRQRGGDRVFESPALTPGSEYVYQLKAQWTEDGQAVTRTRTITIHAGDQVNIDFSNLRTTETQGASNQISRVAK